MKKLLSLLLCVCMTVTMVGCGGSEDAYTPTEKSEAELDVLLTPRKKIPSEKGVSRHA